MNGTPTRIIVVEDDSEIRTLLADFLRREGFDGSWRFSRITNCGGIGVRNFDGHLVCGTD